MGAKPSATTAIQPTTDSACAWQHCSDLAGFIGFIVFVTSLGTQHAVLQAAGGGQVSVQQLLPRTTHCARA